MHKTWQQHSEPSADSGTKPMLPAVAWQEIGEDDYMAVSKCGEYLLRAESINDNQWWWEVSKRTDKADDKWLQSWEIGGFWWHEETPTTKEEALRLAEKCYHDDLCKSNSR